MNLFKRTSILLIAVVLSFSLFAAGNEKEKVKTIEFKVSGVCEMCEKRIEDAALIKGVKMADWDKEAQKIKVVYRPDKTDEQTIHQAIAKVGHDTEKVKATAEAYDKLHECCKYREGQAVH
ncbi:MAG: cation transporter [Prolixibacteraceae bacterium]